MGSFATRDTMLDQIPYEYCGHDPVNWADPSGHFGTWQEIAGTIMLGVAAVIVKQGIEGAVIALPFDWSVVVGGLVIIGGALLIWGVIGDIRDGGGMATWIRHLISIQMPSDPPLVDVPPGVGAGVPGSLVPSPAAPV